VTVRGYIIAVFTKPVEATHAGQLSLAIPQWVDVISTGDGYGHRQGRNGELCLGS